MGPIWEQGNVFEGLASENYILHKRSVCVPKLGVGGIDGLGSDTNGRACKTVE